MLAINYELAIRKDSKEKSVSVKVVLEISRYFYHEIFCYLDTISRKVWFMAIVL